MTEQYVSSDMLKSLFARTFTMDYTSSIFAIASGNRLWTVLSPRLIHVLNPSMMNIMNIHTYAHQDLIWAGIPLSK